MSSPPPKRRGPSIPSRIFAAFAVVLLGFGALAVGSVYQHERTAERLRLLHDGYLPLAIRIGFAKSQQAIHRQHLARVTEDSFWVRLAVSATVNQVRPATDRRLRHHLERATQLANRTGDSLTLPPVGEALAAATAEHEAQADNYRILFETLEAEENAEAIQAQLQRSENRIGEHYDDAYRYLQERIDAIGAQATEQERQAAILLGVFTLLALILGAGTTYWAVRLLRPLPLLEARVNAVAAGDLSAAELVASGDDELSMLARQFEDMVEALNARDRRLGELRQMQQQIVADLDAAIVVVDQNGDIRSANPAAARVLGITEDAIGTSMKDLELPELDELFREALQGHTAHREELSHGRRHLNLTVAPFGLQRDPSEANTSSSVLLVASDVSESLRTKARLIRSERLAAIGRMAAHVTHEVRNPLSSIGLNTELLEDELQEDAEEARTLLRAIQQEIDRLTGITNEYLRLARLPHPRLEAEDLGALLEALKGFLHLEMERANVELALEIAPDLPPVAIDEAQLRQALMNILRNAREAMDGGTIHLRAEAAGSDVRLRIDDSGAGIAEADRAHIFDLFFTTKERGTGLGLPLTQQIIVAHGGRIHCLDAPGGGTRFEIHLPTATGPAHGPAAPNVA